MLSTRLYVVLMLFYFFKLNIKNYLQEDGSVSAWDLREPDSMHVRRKFGKTEAVMRSETFSTGSFKCSFLFIPILYCLSSILTTEVLTM